jgi:hypothetical protein
MFYGRALAGCLLFSRCKHTSKLSIQASIILFAASPIVGLPAIFPPFPVILPMLPSSAQAAEGSVKGYNGNVVRCKSTGIFSACSVHGWLVLCHDKGKAFRKPPLRIWEWWQSPHLLLVIPMLPSSAQAAEGSMDGNIGGLCLQAGFAIVCFPLFALTQKVEQKNQGKGNGSAAFSRPAHNRHA